MVIPGGIRRSWLALRVESAAGLQRAPGGDGLPVRHLPGGDTGAGRAAGRFWPFTVQPPDAGHPGQPDFCRDDAAGHGDQPGLPDGSLGAPHSAAGAADHHHPVHRAQFAFGHTAPGGQPAKCNPGHRGADSAGLFCVGTGFGTTGTSVKGTGCC